MTGQQNRYECFIGQLWEDGEPEITQAEATVATWPEARMFMLAQLLPFMDEPGGDPGVKNAALRAAVDLLLTTPPWLWTAEVEGNDYRIKRQTA